MTLVTGILLAFGYYGTRGALETGFAQEIPAPFYVLAIALVFVLELSRARPTDSQEVARAVAVTAVFGTLVVLAIEGGAYLWQRPEAALEGFVGVGVLGVALIVAALVYVGYLAILSREVSSQPNGDI